MRAVCDFYLRRSLFLEMFGIGLVVVMPPCGFGTFRRINGETRLWTPPNSNLPLSVKAGARRVGVPLVRALLASWCFHSW